MKKHLNPILQYAGILAASALYAAAIALYEKFGFQQVGLRKGFYSHPRDDAIIMTREFPQNAE